MNDERLDSEIRAALLQDDPGSVPAGLQRRVDAVPDEVAGRRRSVGWPHASRLAASIEAIAAVLAVAALVGTAIYLRSSSVGPGTSGSATESPSGPAPSVQPVASPTTLPTGNPTASPLGTTAAPTPVPGWTALSWSGPSIIPNALSLTNVVSWNGRLITSGFADDVVQQHVVAFWGSSDGETWSRIGVNASAFSGSTVVSLTTTPSGLVAVGYSGQGACNGSGEGMTCDPNPVMFWTSRDGSNWTRITDVSMFAGATIETVAVGAHGLIAVGDTGWDQPAIWASPTGSAWHRMTLSTTVFAKAHFSDVAVTAAGYVLGGSVGGAAPQCCAGGGSAGVAAAWWSTNGSTWTRATVNRKAGVGASLGSIYVGAEGLVAVGSASGGKEGAAWTSTDGHTWQPIAVDYLGAAPVSGTVVLPSFTLTGDGTRLVAYGWDAQSKLEMWVSPDGVTWQPLSFAGATGTMPGAGGYVAQPIGGFNLVPGGLIVTGQQSHSAQLVIWRVTGQP